MTNQLIPVFNGTISNETTLLVNARDLHEFLGVGKRFASWITERISEYGFIENQDYVIISQNREIIKRGRPTTDYHLTLDTAKELAMVERNDKGRQVRRYFIECEKQLMQSASRPKQPPVEPLSPADMQNLTHLVWLMSNGMKFNRAWSQGIWYSLRAVTGRPSPQPFAVNDLPALAEECQRIIKISSAFNHAVYEFEKDVIRKVIRKREDINPIIEQMNSRILEMKQQESEGLLMLSKFDQANIASLIARR